MKIKLVSVLEITITSKSIKGRVLLCLVMQGGLGTTAEVTQLTQDGRRSVCNEPQKAENVQKWLLCQS